MAQLRQISSNAIQLLLLDYRKRRIVIRHDVNVPLEGVQKPDEEVNGKNYDVPKGRGLVLVQMVRPCPWSIAIISSVVLRLRPANRGATSREERLISKA
jgi:hypothetical protein